MSNKSIGLIGFLVMMFGLFLMATLKEQSSANRKAASVIIASFGAIACQWGLTHG